MKAILNPLAGSGPRLLHAVVEHYRLALRACTSAQSYLERLGIGPELQLRFRLGFVDRTLGLRIPFRQVSAGKRIRDELEAAGVIRDSGHEHLRGAVVVPVLDGESNVVQMYGRKPWPGSRAPSGEELRLPRPVALWNIDALMPKQPLVLVHGVFDGLRLAAAGIISAALPADERGSEDPECAKWIAAMLRERDVNRVVLVHREGGGEVAQLYEGMRGAGNDVVICTLPARRMLTFDELRGRVGVRLDGSATSTARTRSAKPVVALEVVDPEPKFEPEPEAHHSALVAIESTEPPSAESVTHDGVQASDEQIVVYGQRRWRVRGLLGNRARGTMRVNVVVTCDSSGGMHVDTLDLYVARQRQAFVQMAIVELGVEEFVIKRDMARLLFALEEAQAEMLRRTDTPEPETPEMSPGERAAALELMRDPRLLERVLADLDQLGVVGERDNLLIAYLATVSRFLSSPLAVVVQSSSAAGKSNLLRAVLSLVPPEDRRVFSAMTGQSLYYMGNGDLRHKVLCLAEDQGIGKATYALKMLQSDGVLSIATTAKDPANSRMTTQTYEVEGPVALLLTTTALDLDGELLSRCLVLTVDESAEQTQRIHTRQRQARTVSGLRRRVGRDAVQALHHNAQRLLEPVLVAGCSAESSSTYADLRVRARRDHQKLLALAETIAFLHQHQRRKHTLAVDGATLTYIETLPEDLELAQRLLRSVTPGFEELPEQTLRILRVLREHVRLVAQEIGARPVEVRVRRQDIQVQCGVGPTQLKLHLRRLVEAELLLVHRGAQGRAEYSLCVEPSDATSLDTSDSTSSADAVGGVVGGRSGGGRGPNRPQFLNDVAGLPGAVGPSGRSHKRPRNSRIRPKRTRRRSLMPARGWRKPIVGNTTDPDGLIAWALRFAEDRRVKGYSPHSVTTARGAVLLFTQWAHERGIDRPKDVDQALVEAYQRSLFYARNASGQPMTLSSQRARLQAVRGYFKWLARSGVIPFSPAGEVDLPRLERRLPTAVFNEKEVEQVLAMPDIATPIGLRDRAMMEVLYSSGLRRAELAALRVGDIDAQRGTVAVRLGKGRKDRVVPIGERALMWVGRYLEEVRPDLVMPPGSPVLFLSEVGLPLKLARLTQLMTRYVDHADLGKTGACHIFRHTMATVMLEGGADVRLIQEILGHAELSTTQIYTRVSIKHLKAVHRQTHPGASLDGKRPLVVAVPGPEVGPDELAAMLDAEAREEQGQGR